MCEQTRLTGSSWRCACQLGDRLQPIVPPDVRDRPVVSVGRLARSRRLPLSWAHVVSDAQARRVCCDLSREKLGQEHVTREAAPPCTSRKGFCASSWSGGFAVVRTLVWLIVNKRNRCPVLRYVLCSG